MGCERGPLYGHARSAAGYLAPLYVPLAARCGPAPRRRERGGHERAWGAARGGGERFDGVTIGLRAVDGVIVELGAGVVAAPGDEVVDGTGLALLPGLVNGHGHAAMTLFTATAATSR